MLRRETMIALRARHEALEVARDVAYPPLEVTPPLPAIPLSPDSSPPPTPDWWDAADRTDHPLRRCVYVPDDAPPDPPDPPPPPRMVVQVLMSDVVLSLLMILLGVAVVLLCKYG